MPAANSLPSEEKLRRRAEQSHGKVRKVLPVSVSQSQISHRSPSMDTANRFSSGENGKRRGTAIAMVQGHVLAQTSLPSATSQRRKSVSNRFCTKREPLEKSRLPSGDSGHVELHQLVVPERAQPLPVSTLKTRNGFRSFSISMSQERLTTRPSRFGKKAAQNGNGVEPSFLEVTPSCNFFSLSGLLLHIPDADFSVAIDTRQPFAVRGESQARRTGHFLAPG